MDAHANTSSIASDILSIGSNFSSSSSDSDIIFKAKESNFIQIGMITLLCFIAGSKMVKSTIWELVFYMRTSLGSRNSSKILFSLYSKLRQIWYCLILHYYGIKWSLIELVQMHRKFDISGIPKRPGHVAVITGGARGIGLHVVKKLLACEMHVIIGCRNVTSGRNAVNQIRESGLTSGQVDILELDLMSLESVWKFGDEILAKNIPVHILINNAGIMFVPYQLTKDGFESHFQVNYLGHFLLTKVLLPKMIETARSSQSNMCGRVVNVSSCAHYGGTFIQDDLSMRKFYSPYLGYMVSKFLQVVSSNGINRQLSEQKANVVVNSVHPGIVQTELYENLWWVNAFQCLVRLFFKDAYNKIPDNSVPILPIVFSSSASDLASFKSPEQGADSVVYTAMSPNLENIGGQYIANSLNYEPNVNTKCIELQELLLQTSCQ